MTLPNESERIKELLYGDQSVQEAEIKGRQKAAERVIIHNEEPEHVRQARETGSAFDDDEWSLEP